MNAKDVAKAQAKAFWQSPAGARARAGGGGVCDLCSRDIGIGDGCLIGPLGSGDVYPSLVCDRCFVSRGLQPWDGNTASMPAAHAAAFAPVVQMARVGRQDAKTVQGSGRKWWQFWKRGKELTLDLGKGVKMEMVLIPAGEFMMGSPDTEEGRGKDEGPQHKVTISKPFYMGKYEVTQAQWQAVMGSNPSDFKGDGNLPVESVSWDDCQEFCKKLSQKAGMALRLPTEAEWEYACRAGTKTRFSHGDSGDQLNTYAWYDDNSGDMTHPVGQKEPNAFGLYDMHGNVWEWCQDWWGSYSSESQVDPTGASSESERVLRGGSWNDYPGDCRSALRYRLDPDLRNYDYGLRVVGVVAGLAGTR